MGNRQKNNRCTYDTLHFMGVSFINNLLFTDKKIHIFICTDKRINICILKFNDTRLRLSVFIQIDYLTT